MAKYGAIHPCFAKAIKQDAGVLPTYETGVVIGKLVAANVTVTLATGELFADDIKAEYASEFVSASCAMETDDMEDSVASLIYGAAVVDGAVHYAAGDAPPEGGLGYVKKLQRRGKRFYQGYFYPRAKAALGNDNAQTKGSSITFATTQTTFEIMDPEVSSEVGGWRMVRTFDREADAIAWVENKANIKKAHEVSIIVNGDGSVTPSGRMMVADGGSLTLSFGTTDPDYLYDNGVDVTASIASSAYELSSVAEAHNIVAVFTA